MTMTPAKLARSFVNRNNRSSWSDSEKEWLQTVFGAILKVCRANREFTVDAIWEQISILASKGQLKINATDHRVLGPMLRHMVGEGILGSTGYYTKSTRRGGGSRPVTIWESYIYTKSKAKA